MAYLIYDSKIKQQSEVHNMGIICVFAFGNYFFLAGHQKVTFFNLKLVLIDFVS